MLRPARILKRGLSIIALGSLACLLSACYGVYVQMEVSLNILARDRTSKAGVPGLRLRLFDSAKAVIDEGYTGSDGRVILGTTDSVELAALAEGGVTVQATDVDGSENGSYAEVSMDVPATSNGETEFIVDM